MHDQALGQVEVAFRHPIKFIANALGAPPPEVIAQARALGIKTAALAGKPKLTRSATGTPGSIMSWHKVTGRGTLRRGDDHGSRA